MIAIALDVQAALDSVLNFAAAKLSGIVGFLSSTLNAVLGILPL